MVDVMGTVVEITNAILYNTRYIIELRNSRDTTAYSLRTRIPNRFLNGEIIHDFPFPIFDL